MKHFTLADEENKKTDGVQRICLQPRWEIVGGFKEEKN